MEEDRVWLRAALDHDNPGCEGNGGRSPIVGTPRVCLGVVAENSVTKLLPGETPMVVSLLGVVPKRETIKL